MTYVTAHSDDHSGSAAHVFVEQNSAFLSYYGEGRFTQYVMDEDIYPFERIFSKVFPACPNTTNQAIWNPGNARQHQTTRGPRFTLNGEPHAVVYVNDVGCNA